MPSPTSQRPSIDMMHATSTPQGIPRSPKSSSGSPLEIQASVWERRMQALVQPHHKCIRCIFYKEPKQDHPVLNCAEWPHGRDSFESWVQSRHVSQGTHTSCGLPFSSRYCRYIGRGDCQWKDTMLPCMYWCLENALIHLMPLLRRYGFVGRVDMEEVVEWLDGCKKWTVVWWSILQSLFPSIL